MFPAFYQQVDLWKGLIIYWKRLNQRRMMQKNKNLRKFNFFFKLQTLTLFALSHFWAGFFFCCFKKDQTTLYRNAYFKTFFFSFKKVNNYNLGLIFIFSIVCYLGPVWWNLLLHLAFHYSRNRCWPAQSLSLDSGRVRERKKKSRAE